MALKRIKILFVTTGLESGGAEMSLYKLVTRMDRTRFDCSVLSLTNSGPVLGARIAAEGIPLHCLGLRRGAPDPRMVTRLAHWIAQTKPDVVQTWMYHADLIGTLASVLARRPGRNIPVIWSVHCTSLMRGKNKSQTLQVVGLNSKLSHRGPACVLCCSDAALETHRKIGYRADRLQVIASGIDTEEYVPNPAARADVRRELGIPLDAPLIGLSARFDPQKDHETFFRAAARLREVRPDAHFLLWGVNVSPDNPDLTRWAQAAGVLPQTHLLGLRPDTARLTAALDAATCCSSFGESFALVVGEAMACGVPCVTTAMPGPQALVGDVGWVVPVKDDDALARAWQEMLSLTPPALHTYAENARARIEHLFSLRKTVREYEDFYTHLLHRPAPQHQEADACAV